MALISSLRSSSCTIFSSLHKPEVDLIVFQMADLELFAPVHVLLSYCQVLLIYVQQKIGPSW